MRPTNSQPLSTPRESDLLVLTRRAAAGDPEAFAALYDETAPHVHGMVSRMVADPAAAEKVTESAYLLAYAEIATSARERTGVLAWLLDVAHTEALVQVRSESPDGRGQRVLDELARDESLDPAPTGLWAAMARLTGSQRRSLHLAYFGGLHHDEVDTALDLPRGASSVRMSDGLHALRDHLEELGLLVPVSAG